MKVCRGKKCNHIGIVIDYLTRSASKVDIADCIGIMKEDFSSKTNKTTKLWTNKLLQVNTNFSRLNKEKSNVFHILNVKRLFCAKEAIFCGTRCRIFIFMCQYCCGIRLR